LSVINILTPHVADLIAAGEVVDRPASVVKELMENSLDAGATRITVEIHGGGAQEIRIADNGKGMSPEDAGIAFLRHATSKIRKEEDLEAIRTMGFRGEALAAIGSVSRVEMMTREPGSQEGTQLRLEAGEIQDMQPCGCPEGTVLTVRNLFYNTPARLKFLKSDRAEGTACVQTAARVALGRPDVSIRCIRDEREEFSTPGDGEPKSAAYEILGREVVRALLPCSGTRDEVKVSGFVSSPRYGRGNRAQQFFFCNHRYIRSTLLQAAVEQAYRNTLLTGRFPACILYLDLSFASVDVNVHPAKTEVKFHEEKKVFDAVYYTVRSALQGETVVYEPGETLQEKKPAVRNENYFRTMTARQFREKTDTVHNAPKQTPAPDYDMLRRQPLATPVPRAGKTPSARPDREKRESQPNPSGDPERLRKPVQPVSEEKEKAGKPLPSYRLIGEVMKTYILLEVQDQLVLIDKHACHERMIFDRLRSQEAPEMVQRLLVPVILRPDSAEAEILEEKAELLRNLGFEIDLYGTGTYAVRAVPAEMNIEDIAPALEEICDVLQKQGEITPQDLRDRALRTVACKAAIKAGWDSSEEELRVLADAVVSGKIKYCPHGRPVALSYSRRDLDKLFKRIV
jgi:DNA mismatch repair protein MutL